MKRIRLELDSGHFDYRQENEWLHEYNILSKLRHFTETLMILDFFICELFLFIVTELCFCGDLQKLIEQKAATNHYFSETEVRMGMA